jgi:hypothetical protein
MGVLTHVQVMAVHNSWFFLKERERALGTDRTDPGTIWIGHQEYGVSHQLNHAGSS